MSSFYDISGIGAMTCLMNDCIGNQHKDRCSNLRGPDLVCARIVPENNKKNFISEIIFANPCGENYG